MFWLALRHRGRSSRHGDPVEYLADQDVGLHRRQVTRDGAAVNAQAEHRPGVAGRFKLNHNPSDHHPTRSKRRRPWATPGAANRQLALACAPSTSLGRVGALPVVDSSTRLPYEDRIKAISVKFVGLSDPKPTPPSRRRMGCAPSAPVARPVTHG